MKANAGRMPQPLQNEPGRKAFEKDLAFLVLEFSSQTQVGSILRQLFPEVKSGSSVKMQRSEPRPWERVQFVQRSTRSLTVAALNGQLNGFGSIP